MGKYQEDAERREEYNLAVHWAITLHYIALRAKTKQDRSSRANGMEGRRMRTRKTREGNTTNEIERENVITANETHPIRN